MAAGKFEINAEFVGRWVADDDGTLNVYVVPLDPARSIFHGVIYPYDEGGYTKFAQDSDRAKEVVGELVSDASLPADYRSRADDAVVAADEKRTVDRIAELQVELDVLIVKRDKPKPPKG